MGISSKLIKYRNANKFSIRNALRTAHYLLGIVNFAWRRLKFLDEVRHSFAILDCLGGFAYFPAFGLQARFESRKLQRERGWAERGREIHRVMPAGNGWPSYSVTVLTDLTNPHGFWISNPTTGWLSFCLLVCL